MAHIIHTILRVEASAGDDLAGRRKLLRKIDEAGILATPANSSYNELVIEAGRLSLACGGREAVIEYTPNPRVYLRPA